MAPSVTPSVISTSQSSASVTRSVTATLDELNPDQRTAFEQARQLLVEGDNDAAVERWRQLNSSPGLPAAAASEARFELVLALARAHRGTEALQVLATPPPAPDSREGFARGLALEAANHHVEAMSALADVAAANPAIAPAVWLEVAEMEQAAHRPKEAADATAKGLDTAQLRPLKQRLLEVRAQALGALGDTEAAFDAHRQVLALATSRATLGEQLFRLAQASRDLGKRDEAIRALKTALDEFPSATTTADALRLLDDLGAAGEVDPFILGRARYFAVDYRNAVAAFDQYLAAEPNGPDAPSARLYRALASLSPGNEPNALRDLDAIADDPNQETEIAAQALVEAGQALEGLAEPDQAEARYQKLLERFPRLDAAATAGFRLGLVRFVRGADAEAIAAWDALLARRDDLATSDVSRAFYWRGKALNHLGRTDEARASWQQAADLRPADYYTLRAASLLGQLSAGGGSPNAAVDPTEERQLADWMAGRHLDLAGAATTLDADPALARARAEASIGLFREGNWEADELLQRYPDRSDRLYWLSRRFGELGLAGGATRLGQAALDTAGVESPVDAPSALRKVAYPRPFDSLVNTAADRYGIDPLLLSATFRQASQFDAWAEDAASGARGLARISPIHAEEAGRGLHMSPDDRLRPVAGVEQQAWLMADRLRRFDGRPEVVLAALAVTDRIVDGWLVRPGADDPDVFIEQIDYEGTRTSVRDVLSARVAYGITYAAAGQHDPLAAITPKPEPTAAWIKIERLAGDQPPAAPLEPAADVGTPDEQAAFAHAAVLQRDGDDEAAANEFRALAGHADPSVADAARRRLGEALLGAGRPADALEPLQAAAQAAAPGSSASFLLGRALASLGRCEEALPHFQSFIDSNPGPLAAHGKAALASCLQDLGRPAEALAPLDEAVRTPDLPRLQVIDFREQLALARVRAGDLDSARADYQSLLAGARSGSYRAQLNYTLGVLAGDPATAAARFRTAVQADPKSRAAQAALDELVSLQDPFATSFEAGDTRFEQDRYREARAAYTAFLNSNPSDARAPKADYGRGVALVRLGQDRAGIAVLEGIAQRVPGTLDAADGLFRGGRIRESLADLAGAAQAYQSAMAQPGAGSRGLDARFRLAFVQFRTGDYDRAAAGWRDLAGRVRDPDDRAQAFFWLGKALHAAGDEAGARAAWTSAHDADPHGFYGLRAEDHLSGGADADSPRAHVDQTTPMVERHAVDDLTAELRAWATSRGNVGAAQQRLDADPALGRAEQLLGLGLRREAIRELDALEERLGRDVAALALLGGWEHSHGLYNTALVLGFDLASVANVSLTSGPAAVRKLVYPLPNPSVLARAGQQLAVDPLLFSGLMRQESNMDQYVESAAQARGLSQLIATTAYEAARALGRYDFHTTELFQPQTSITLGAYTFGRRLARYDQHIFPAVAAYNASQFAVDGWLLAAGPSDIDTFAEAIPFTETYPYVQRIYENYRQYLELYGNQ